MSKESQRLLELCKKDNFNTEEAQALLSSINANAPLDDPSWKGHKTTLLLEAILSTNLKMTQLLLKNGADPNMIWNDENPFWDLQYNEYCNEMYEKDPEVAYAADEKRLLMAQLMLEHGADPCITVDQEDLFSYVLFAVFEDDPGPLLDYRSRFLILLIAYGGKNHYCQPNIQKPFDKSNMAQYRFRRVPVGDGYHLTGEIVDDNYEVVATL